MEIQLTIVRATLLTLLWPNQLQGKYLLKMQYECNVQMLPHKTAWWKESHKQLSALHSERRVLWSQILNKAPVREKKVPNHRQRKGKQHWNPAMARKSLTDYINDSFWFPVSVQCLYLWTSFWIRQNRYRLQRRHNIVLRESFQSVSDTFYPVYSILAPDICPIPRGRTGMFI